MYPAGLCLPAVLRGTGECTETEGFVKHRRRPQGLPVLTRRGRAATGGGGGDKDRKALRLPHACDQRRWEAQRTILNSVNVASTSASSTRQSSRLVRPDGATKGHR